MRRLVGWGLANETVGRVGHAEQSNAVSRLGGIQGMGAGVRHAADIKTEGIDQALTPPSPAVQALKNIKKRCSFQ